MYGGGHSASSTSTSGSGGGGGGVRRLSSAQFHQLPMSSAAARNRQRMRETLLAQSSTRDLFVSQSLQKASSLTSVANKNVEMAETSSASTTMLAIGSPKPLPALNRRQLNQHYDQALMLQQYCAAQGIPLPSPKTAAAVLSLNPGSSSAKKRAGFGRGSVSYEMQQHIYRQASVEARLPPPSTEAAYNSSAAVAAIATASAVAAQLPDENSISLFATGGKLSRFRDAVVNAYQSLIALLGLDHDDNMSYYEELFEVEQVRYRPISLDDLRYKSGLHRSYIVELYRGFKQECPAGTVDEHDFINIYSKYYPQGDASAFARRVFRHIDKDKRGYITFEDFLLFVARITVHGTDEQRLRFCFKLYDTGSKGFLTEQDLSTVMEEIHLMRGFDELSMTTPTTDMLPLERIQANARALFRKFDPKETGRVSMRQFVAACLADKITVASMQVFVDKAAAASRAKNNDAVASRPLKQQVLMGPGLDDATSVAVTENTAAFPPPAMVRVENTKNEHVCHVDANLSVLSENFTNSHQIKANGVGARRSGNRAPNLAALEQHISKAPPAKVVFDDTIQVIVEEEQ